MRVEAPADKPLIYLASYEASERRSVNYYQRIQDPSGAMTANCGRENELQQRLRRLKA